INLAGTGIQTELSRAPTALSFGSKGVNDGATSAKTSTVINSGTEDVTLTGVSVTGDFAQATGNADDCFSGRTLLHAGDTCKLRLRFDPTTTGPGTGTATVNSDTAPVAVALSGTGIPTDLSRSAGSISAGSQDVDDGPPTPQEATITNTGTEDVTISSVDVTGEFGQATGQGSDCTPSKVLHAGETCKLRVQFDPATIGAKTGSATVHSTVADIVIALDGTGIQT